MLTAWPYWFSVVHAINLLQISSLPSALWERQKRWEFPPPNGSMNSPTESQWEAMQSNLAQVIGSGNRLHVVGLVFRAPHVWEYSQGGYVGNKTIRGAMGESHYRLDYPKPRNVCIHPTHHHAHQVDGQGDELVTTTPP